jgi:bacterial/archaeal transporter family-2 protein
VPVARSVYLILPLVGGALIAAQAPINARLRTILESPVGSAFVSFAIGTAVLFAALAVVGDVPRLGALGGGPWWAYVGGACGAVFVFATLVASPRVGVTATFVAVILGQVMAAALIDRFGWLGVPSVPVRPERLVAIGLLAVSVVLLARK